MATMQKEDVTYYISISPWQRDEIDTSNPPNKLTLGKDNLT
jgi:hypothetical protein